MAIAPGYLVAGCVGCDPGCTDCPGTRGSVPVSALYNVIPLRHTNRYPYDTGHPVTTATLDALSALGDDADVRVFWFASAEKRKPVGDLMVAAAQAFVADKAQDGVDTGTWWRGTWQDIQQQRDGITLDAAGLPDLTRAIGKMLPSVSVEQQEFQLLAEHGQSSQHRRSIRLARDTQQTRPDTTIASGPLVGTHGLMGHQRGARHAAAQPGNRACIQRDRAGESPLTLAMPCKRWWVMLPGRPS